jgi:hypothetical protein
MCESRLANLTSRRLNLVGVVLAALFTGTLAVAVYLAAGG